MKDFLLFAKEHVGYTFEQTLDLFLAAAERLRVPPSGCVVLEDSEAGIRAAHAAGMVPVMIPDLVTPTEEMRNLAEAVLPSLFEAGEFLARQGRYNA